MRRFTTTLLSTSALILLGACSASSEADINAPAESAVSAAYTYGPSVKNIKAHMDYLASDDLLGRETSSRYVLSALTALRTPEMSS